MASSLNERFITSLNNDIFITIFEHMDVEDLKNICLVNSRFYELVTNTSSVNKKFGLDIDSNYNATIIEALMKSNRHFEHMSIPSSKHDSDKPMTCKSSQVIDLMKKVGGRVKNIEFKSEDTIECPKPIFKLLEIMPNIESLRIFPHYISSECVEKLPKSTIFKFNQLKEVQIPFVMIFRILKHVNTLEKLIVLKSGVIDLNYRSKILELIEVLRNNQSTLKSLKFNTMEELFKHDIQALCNLNLFEFYLSEPADRNLARIEILNNCVKFLSNQHQMKRLTFYMDNAAFWNPIMKMTNLEFLDLEIDYNLCNEQILTILQNRTNTSVKFLKISFGYDNSSLKLCHAILDYFYGVVNLDLSIFPNAFEDLEGWLFSFDDHPALKRVTLRTYANGPVELRALKIHQLEEVFIETEPGFTADNWNIFTTNNPNIKSLTIKGSGLDTESLKYIFTNLVELEEFKFDQEYCPAFQNADLRFILQNCRNLKIIDIILHEKPGLHSEVLEEFAEKLKTIKLTIKFDPWSDDDSTDNCADDNSCSPSYFD